MERSEAFPLLRALVGQDLRVLADTHRVSICGESGKTNKGWAGHVIERYLGLPLNCAQAPNFGSWELKVVPLKRLRDGSLRVKETMAITMIDPVEVALKEFEDSHLYRKLQRMIVVSRLHGGEQDGPTCHLYGAAEFDLSDPVLLDIIRSDYNLIRDAIRDPERGFSSLTGKMGRLIQPRTKGPGHGSISRAFYARPGLVAHILGLETLSLTPAAAAASPLLQTVA